MEPRQQLQEPAWAEVIRTLPDPIRQAIADMLKAVQDAANREKSPRTEYLTIEQACEYLQVSRPTFYRISRRVRPPMRRVKLDRAVRIKRSEPDRAAEALSRNIR